MRLILFILAFIGLSAQGQIINASAPYRPLQQQLLLDQFPNAAAAYSLRKLRTAYLGNAIRVRRSNDNAEQDIGFTASGDLDTASLKTFVGANSGFVTTWYDQSGNARNATQSTALNQPRIVNAGVIDREGARPTVIFDGSNDSYSVTGISLAQPYSSFFVQKRTNTSSQSLWVSGSNSTNSVNAYAPVIYATFGVFITHFNATQSGANASVNNTNFILMSGFATASNTYSLFINNSSISVPSVNDPQKTANVTRIGQRSAVEFEYTNGKVSEIIIYNSDQSSNRTGIESNINTYYSIY